MILSMFIFNSCSDMPPFPVDYSEPIKIVAIEEVEKPEIVKIYIDPKDVTVENRIGTILAQFWDTINGCEEFDLEKEYPDLYKRLI